MSLRAECKNRMREIKSLCDALLETHVQEDQCTNLFLWLLRKLPPFCLQEVCRESGIILDEVSTEYGFHAQLVLEKSRPDGLIKFARDKFLIIETKRFPNALNKSQFENHITGSVKEFGALNCWFLFISGDSEEPSDLGQMRSIYGNRIGFISWSKLLALFTDIKQRLEKPYSILLDEFLIFAQYQRLGRLINMNADEIKAYLAAYPTVQRYQEAAQEKFSKMLAKITDYIICECGDRVTKFDEEVTWLPCLYRSLKVKGWHIPDIGLFVFLNIMTKEIWRAPEL